MQCNLDGQSAYNGVGALEEAAPATPGPAPADPTGNGPWLNGNMKVEFNDDQVRAYHSAYHSAYHPWLAATR